MSHAALITITVLILLIDGRLLLDEESLVEHLNINLNLLDQLLQLLIGKRIEHCPDIVPQLILTLQVLIRRLCHVRRELRDGWWVFIVAMIAYHSIAISIIVVLRILLIHLRLRRYWVTSSAIEL